MVRGVYWLLLARQCKPLCGRRRRQCRWGVCCEAGNMIGPATRARRKGQNGNAIIEFALAVSFIFPMVTGLFQFGYAFFVYNQLQSAVREGARYAAYKTYDSGSSTPSTAFSDAVKTT